MRTLVVTEVVSLGGVMDGRKFVASTTFGWSIVGA